MKVLVVSGIWPPDVGGPASHAPDVADFLRTRGHRVEVVVTAARAPAREAYPVHWTSRSLPVGIRHAAAADLIRRRAHAADAVYTTGMFVRSALGARAAGRAYVVKLTGDPAFERARRYDGARDLDRFQESAGGPLARTLRATRDATLRGAAHVFCPSAWLAELALEWGVDPARVSVLPNPAPQLPALPPRDELRRRLGFDGPTLVWAGRLTAQKALPTLVEAVAQTEGVRLVVAGDGEELAAVRQVAAASLGERASFLGPQPRARVLELFAAADAAVLSSSWENFPHAVVEALAAGTPVIATAVGGVDEIVEDGRNGLVVPPLDAAAFAGAIRRFVDDPALQERLRAAAAPSVERFARDALFGELEAALERAAR